MSYQVTRTKIILPRRRSDLLSRPRLLNLLADMLDFRLIILIAPAGYGKTFLLVDFAHQIELPVCWYALDALDRDTYRFCSHFIASVQQKFPAFGQASFAALQSMTLGQGTLDQLVTTVVNELYDHVREHFVLVLDDFYLVDDNSEINLFVSQLIQQVDENCHLIIASRRLLSLPDMALMVARGYVGGVDFEDLAYEVDELQELSVKNLGQPISATEAKTLIEATDGWIIGLLLSTQSKLRNISGRMRHMRASGINLYDYLAEQVLNQQPPAIQEFLLRTSLLEEFDANLCATVFEGNWQPASGTWQDLIDEVLRRNLFVLPLGEDEAWLRYNYVFQEFLQRRVARESPQVERTILERLAALYQERKEWEKAHYVLTRLGDPKEIVHLLQRAGVSLLDAGRFSLLATWLSELPAEFSRTCPLLVMLQGAIKTRQGEVKAGLLLLDEAIAAEWPAHEQSYWIYALMRRTITHRLLGNYQLALQDIETALHSLEQNPVQTDELLTIIAMAQQSKGITFSLMGQPEEGIFWLEKAMVGYQALNHTQNLALTRLDLAIIYMNTGHYRQALRMFEEVRQVWKNLNDLAEQANVLNNLGYLHHLLGKYEEALTLLEDAYEHAKRSGYTRIIGYALTSMGDLCADLGVLAGAQNLFGEARLVAQRTKERFLLVYLELAHAKLAALQQDWGNVFAALDRAGKLVVDKKSGSEWALYQLTVGYCHWLQGKTKEAIAALRDAVAQFASGGQPIEEASAHFLLAACYALDAPPAARQHLDTALVVAAGLESRSPLLAILRAIQPYLKEKKTLDADERVKALVAESAEMEEAIFLVNRHVRQNPPALLRDFLTVAPHFTMRALGRAEVLVDGKLLNNSDWQTVVSRDLFFCLLAHPQGLTKEEIGGIFWPDASPSELKTRFKNAIYRLRNAFNEEVVLFENDVYAFNRSLDYEYDVDVFLRWITKGEQAQTPEDRSAAYQAALALYRGPYLPELGANWAVFERERLRRLFIEGALALGQLQLEQQAYSATLENVHRILDADPCQEDAHRLAMRVYAALGNRAAVARQYAQCQRALRTEIDAPPSPQTAYLYQTLMH